MCPSTAVQQRWEGCDDCKLLSACSTGSSVPSISAATCSVQNCGMLHLQKRRICCSKGTFEAQALSLSSLRARNCTIGARRSARRVAAGELFSGAHGSELARALILTCA